MGLKIKVIGRTREYRLERKFEKMPEKTGSRKNSSVNMPWDYRKENRARRVDQKRSAISKKRSQEKRNREKIKKDRLKHLETNSYLSKDEEARSCLVDCKIKGHIEWFKYFFDDNNNYLGKRRL